MSIKFHFPYPPHPTPKMTLDLSQETLHTFAAHLAQTTSPELSVRRPAEEFLAKAETGKNFAVILLRTVAKEDADLGVRVAGAIAFKNFVKRNWKVVREWRHFLCKICKTILRYKI